MQGSCSTKWRNRLCRSRACPGALRNKLVPGAGVIGQAEQPVGLDREWPRAFSSRGPQFPINSHIHAISSDPGIEQLNAKAFEISYVARCKSEVVSNRRGGDQTVH
jgi:hypothetical protein